MLEPILHSAEQKSFYELREDFRRSNHERVLATLRWESIQVGTLEYRYQTDGDIFKESRGKSFAKAMNAVQDFGLAIVPSPLLAYASQKAEEIETFEAMIAPAGEGQDYDGPEASPIELMTEAEQISYVEHAIQQSRRDG